MGRFVLLEALKAGIFPVPDAAKPMAVLSFVQVKPMPVTAVNVPMVEADPLQSMLFAGWLIVGIGFTTMLYVDAPGHPPITEGIEVAT